MDALAQPLPVTSTIDMAGTVLSTAFKDKDQVKSLGARWDAERRCWYVPEGLDLAPFAAWLPQGVVPETVGTELTARQGVSLSQLLAGVVQAVSAAYRAGVWTPPLDPAH